jgi:hypothetical protein
MIHEPSGKPVRYVKGVRDGDEFTEVPEEEIVKGNSGQRCCPVSNASLAGMRIGTSVTPRFSDS